MSAAERRWLFGAVLAVSGLAGLPYLLAELLPPPGTRFLGTFWSVYDLAQYLATMREAAASPSWLVHDHLTPEPHTPALIYPLYVTLGKLAGLLGLPDRLVLHLVEIGARALLVVAIYAFSAGFTSSIPARRAALLLALIGAGFGPLAAALASLLGIPPETLGLNATFVEFSTFAVLFAAPHLMLGLALTLVAVRLALAHSPAAPRVLALAGCLAGLGLTNPFGVPATLLVLGLVAVIGAAHRQPGRELFIPLVGAAIGGLPALAYYGLIFNADPFWGATYGRQNALLTPSPLGVVLGLGPVALLAGWSAPGAVRSRDGRQQLLVGWAVAALVLAYLPFPFQRRFLFGLQPVLATMAAPVLVGLLARLGRPGMPPGRAQSPAGRLIRLGLASWLLGSGALTAYLTLLAGPLIGGASEAPHFQPADLFEARAWLAPRLAASETILADAWDGNVLAGGVDGRVFLGHGVATLEPAAKKRALVAFFGPDTADAARARLLAEHCVAYVVESPRSRALGTFRPASSGLFQPVYAAGDVRVHRVALAAEGCEATDGSPRLARTSSR
jgi:hypothetical protein